MSKSTKAGGEGFVMKVDKYGSPAWQKRYIESGSNEDSIDAVDIDVTTQKSF
jgi:hypothetical protein